MMARLASSSSDAHQQQEQHAQQQQALAVVGPLAGADLRLELARARPAYRAIPTPYLVPNCLDLEPSESARPSQVGTADGVAQGAGGEVELGRLDGVWRTGARSAEQEGSVERIEVDKPKTTIRHTRALLPVVPSPHPPAVDPRSTANAESRNDAAQLDPLIGKQLAGDLPPELEGHADWLSTAPRVDLARLSRRKTVCVWWWDSKKRSWVLSAVDVCAYLVPWVRAVLARDLGWHHDDVDLRWAITWGSATMPHDQLSLHTEIPFTHSFEYALHEGLDEVDAVFSIGTRGLGYNTLSLARDVLPRLRRETKIVATRVGGRLPSLVTTAGTLADKMRDLLVRESILTPVSFDLNNDLDKSAMHETFRKYTQSETTALVVDPDSVDEFIAVDSLCCYFGRLGQGLHKKATNAGGNARRFPTKVVGPAAQQGNAKPRAQSNLRAIINAEMKVAQPQASSSTAGKVDSPSVQLPRVRRLETVKAPHDDLASLFGPVFEINATGICVQIGCSSPYVSRQYRLCDEHLPEFMGVDSADPSALTASPSVATTSSAVTPTQASSSSASRGASSRKDRPRDQSDAALPEPNPKRVKTLKKCDICGYTTDDAHTLGVHKKIHAPESFLMCPEPDCVVGYKLPNQLAAHATWHEDPAPSRSCNECQVTFSRVTRLTTHCTNFHSATSTHAYKVWFGDA